MTSCEDLQGTFFSNVELATLVVQILGIKLIKDELECLWRRSMEIRDVWKERKGFYEVTVSNSSFPTALYSVTSDGGTDVKAVVSSIPIRDLQERSIVGLYGRVMIP
jgi:hypothetical protein